MEEGDGTAHPIDGTPRASPEPDAGLPDGDGATCHGREIGTVPSTSGFLPVNVPSPRPQGSRRADPQSRSIGGSIRKTGWSAGSG